MGSLFKYRYKLSLGLGAGSGLLAVRNVAASINGSNVVVTGTSSNSLVEGTWGFSYSLNADTSLSNWVGVAGAASAQSITVPLTDLGVASGDTINLLAGYSLTNPPGTIVDVGGVFQLVSAAYLLLHDGASKLLLENGSGLLREEAAASIAIDALGNAASLADADLTMLVQAAASDKATMAQLKTYVNG